MNSRLESIRFPYGYILGLTLVDWKIILTTKPVFEDFDRADSAACTIDVPVGGFKYHNGQGYIIRFHSISDMIMLYVTHEVIHVACKTWEFLGDDPKTGGGFCLFWWMGCRIV